MAYNLVDNTNYGMKEGQEKATAKSYPFTSASAMLDANNCTTPGLYLAAVSGSSSNLPSGVQIGMLIVSTADNLSGAIYQTFVNFGSGTKVYTRSKTGESWSAWG